MKISHLSFLFALLLVAGCSKNSDNNTDEHFAKGADVGWITEMEQAGHSFYNKQGVQTECMALLKSLGMNTIRLRVWVNPKEDWNGKSDLLIKAKRAQALGMKLMINFHYSDDWADPQKQIKPTAWENLPLEELSQALAAHTKEILTALKNENIEPAWVQVGNETGNGMLWPTGKLDNGFKDYAQLSNAGYDAVKSVFPNCKVIVHLQNGEDNQLFRWFFDGLKAEGGKWDVIGLSVYPYWAKMDWQTCNNKAYSNMNDLVSKYDCEVMVVEAGHPWEKAEEAKLYLTDLIEKTKDVVFNKGTGVIYWEPECYNGWKGYGLGAFDNSGRPTTALDAFLD